MKVSYNWLQDFFQEGALPSVERLEEELTFRAFEIEGVEEIGEGRVIDIDVLPNRSSDALSHRGIAGEIATLFDLELSQDPLAEIDLLNDTGDKLALAVDDEEYNPYHYVALIEGVEVRESPQWLRERLEALGQKSINNVVDATNYVMYELGQPSHAFDADKLSESDGALGIRVRYAQEGEEITLLGGDERTLPESTMVLSDYHTGSALDIAGVKGGTHAELDGETTRVVVSCAKFAPSAVRRAAQSARIRTDAVQRYENDTPDQLAHIGFTRVVRLIQELAGGELVAVRSVSRAPRENPRITLALSELATHTGLTLEMSEAEDILRRLGFEYSIDGEEIRAQAPWWRTDVNIKEELMEELARVYGYARLDGQVLPQRERAQEPLQSEVAMSVLRKALVSRGYMEVMLYSMRKSGVIKLANSLNTKIPYMRENLRDGLAEALARNEHNAPLVGEYSAVKLFEFGKVFPSEHEEVWHGALGVLPLGQKKRAKRMRAELDALRSELKDELGITLPEPTDDGIIEFEISGEMLAHLAESNTEYVYTGPVSESVRYTPASQYPFVQRDIAVWLPDGLGAQEGAAHLREIVLRHGGELLQRVDQFDKFENDGKVSLAFHIIFQSNEKTLTDDEVGEIMTKIERDLANMGFKVR